MGVELVLVPEQIASPARDGGDRRARGGQAVRGLHSAVMQPLKAHVQNGRLVLDEPTDLPDGEVIYLVPVDDGDDLDDAERAALHQSLEISVAQMKAGDVVDGERVLLALRSRRP
ncbi:MAG: hypothetical protein HY908_33130 [Myxococcales bacterium]|nr:hypothetical protein [Myxococcales bacterium]